MAERDWIMEEIPVKERTDTLNGMALVVRVDEKQEGIVAALRNALHDVDPTVPFIDVPSMADVVSETLVFERMESWLFGIFASLALALALVGLYGLVSQEVEQSRRDIGVRMALGASRQRILGMVMRHVSVLLAIGALSGLVLTVIVRRVIGMVIYFDASREAMGFAGLALVLVAVGLIAAILPARRAASIEPMQALRSE
jgi:ABC-type antimicrobial peptide transport system permease subunit